MSLISICVCKCIVHGGIAVHHLERYDNRGVRLFHQIDQKDALDSSGISEESSRLLSPVIHPQRLPLTPHSVVNMSDAELIAHCGQQLVDMRFVCVLLDVNHFS